MVDDVPRHILLRAREVLEALTNELGERHPARQRLMALHRRRRLPTIPVTVAVTVGLFHAPRFDALTAVPSSGDEIVFEHGAPPASRHRRRTDHRRLGWNRRAVRPRARRA